MEEDERGLEGDEREVKKKKKKKRRGEEKMGELGEGEWGEET